MPEANPFQDPLRFERRVPPCAIVIFGANGDLTKRKLIPALYRLAYDRRLPPGFAIIGNSRTRYERRRFSRKDERSPPGIRRGYTVSTNGSGATSLKICFILPATCTTRTPTRSSRPALMSAEVAAYRGQRSLLSLHAAQPLRSGNPGYWLRETPARPRLAAHRCGKTLWPRLSPPPARSTQLQEVFLEQNVYRIDHYLGKETVQNVLAFRFGNGIFEPLWNRR